MAETHSGLVAGNAFSIYHKWDVVKNLVEYTAAFPVKEIPADFLAFIGDNSFR